MLLLREKAKVKSHLQACLGRAQKPLAEQCGTWGWAPSRLGCLGPGPASLLMCLFRDLKLPIAAFCLRLLTSKMSSGDYDSSVCL